VFHDVPIGTKESAFIYSLTNAAVAHSVSRACSQGNLTICSCANLKAGRKKRQRRDDVEYEASEWTWGGCSDNVNFGVKFSQKFIDEQPKDLKNTSFGAESMAVLHNSKMGRKVNPYALIFH